MSAQGMKVSVIQDQDFICMHDRSNPLGNDQFGYGRKSRKSAAHFFFRGGVNCACRIIKDQNFRML